MLKFDTVARRAQALRYLLVLTMSALVLVNGWLWWAGASRFGAGWVSIYSEWPTGSDALAWVPLLGASLVPPLLMLGLGLAGSANVQAISLQLDGSDLWTLLIGAMFFVITSLMVEARQLAEDNEQIV